MNRKISSFTYCIAVALFASGTEAATLHIEKGNVLLSRGAGYETVTSSRHLDVGDTVAARAGAKAKVVFDDDCRVSLEAGMVLTIQQQSPCGSNVEPNAADVASDAPPASDTVLGNDWNGTTEVVSSGTTGTELIFLGAAAVGGIAAAFAFLGAEGDSAPVSP